MTKLIYLIRHGETDFNKLNIVQGCGVDTSLNATGRSQAEMFFAHYQDIKFDKVYISALRRTYESVEPFIKNQQLPFEQIPELNEINWGILEGKKQEPEDAQLFLSIIEQWKKGFYEVKIEGGESPAELQKRQQIALEKIMKNTDEKTILICMHGRAIKSFLCLLLQKPLSEMDQFEHSNLGLYRLHYKQGQFHLELRNSKTHLIKGI